MEIWRGLLVVNFDGNRKPIIPHSLRLKFLTLAHGNHRGVEGTISRMRRNAFWPNSRQDIQKFVSCCRTCALVKPKFVPATLTPFVSKAPMEVVAVDYIGPLPVSKNGFKYMLVFIDLFSRFPEVFPCHDLSTSTLVDKSREYFARYGFPDSL